MRAVQDAQELLQQDSEKPRLDEITCKQLRNMAREAEHLPLRSLHVGRIPQQLTDDIRDPLYVHGLPVVTRFHQLFFRKSMKSQLETV